MADVKFEGHTSKRTTNTVDKIFYSNLTMKKFYEEYPHREAFWGKYVSQDEIEKAFSECDESDPVFIQIFDKEVKVFGSCTDISEVCDKSMTDKHQIQLAKHLIDKILTQYPDYADSYYTDELEDTDIRSDMLYDFDEWRNDYILFPENFSDYLGFLEIQIGCTEQKVYDFPASWYKLYEDYLKEELGSIAESLNCIVDMEYSYITH